MEVGERGTFTMIKGMAAGTELLFAYHGMTKGGRERSGRNGEQREGREVRVHGG